MNKQKTLTGKDLINIGIYTALLFIITMIISMLGFIPIFMPLLAVLPPFFGAIPYMLFLTKVHKFGMITIMSLIVGLLLFITGMGIYPFLCSAITGLIADWVYKTGNFKSSKKAVLSSGIFMIVDWSNFIPLFTNIDKYFSTRPNFDQNYVTTLSRLMPLWMCPVLFASAFIFGILGALFAKVLLKKHFKRAGIA
ncbi:MAG: MptD family putative ECF transporter S component [Treponema sp.]|nr:MptD family putative ECF transporter S component [Treponema sp.]